MPERPSGLKQTGGLTVQNGQTGYNAQASESGLKRTGEPKWVDMDRHTKNCQRGQAGQNGQANRQYRMAKRFENGQASESGLKRTGEPKRVKTDKQTTNCQRGQAG